MPEESGIYKVAAKRVQLPLIATRTTFHWDGIEIVSPSVGSQTGLEHDHPGLPVALSLTLASRQAQCQTATGRHAGSSLTADEKGRACSSQPQTVNWEREAASLIFYLDPRLLLAEAREMVHGATGKLVWLCQGGRAQPISLYVHPVLLVRAADTSLQGDHVELVPHLHASDPLLHHILLVLQAEIDAEGVAGRLYAEALTNALAVHLLRRYGTCRPPIGAQTGSLPRPKLRRTIEYIEAYLAHELSLTELAAVAQTSPAHFARQFKQATGRTPHQYVIMRRIECAQRLLTETDLPIIDIGPLVGFTDQSYFTAVFHRYVATTPKAYRDNTQQ